MEKLIEVSRASFVAQGEAAGAIEVARYNREAWLQAAVDKLRPMFLGQNYKVPEVAVSVGWPSSGGLGVSKRTIGQCWFGSMTANNTPQLFISPLLDETCHPMGVLATLVHEICHVVAGPDAKHGPQFVKVMKKVMLEGKPTSTNASEDLCERFKQIVAELGPFPHSKIVPSPKDPKKQTTRMKKCQCRDCEYVARTVQKWLDLYGPPICPCNKMPMATDAVETEPEDE